MEEEDLPKRPKLLKWIPTETPHLASSYAGKSSTVPKHVAIVCVCVDVSKTGGDSSLPLPNCPPHWFAASRARGRAFTQRSSCFAKRAFQSRVVKSFDLIAVVRKRQGHNAQEGVSWNHILLREGACDCLQKPKSCRFLTVDAATDHDATGVWKKKTFLYMLALQIRLWNEIQKINQLVGV